MGVGQEVQRRCHSTMCLPLLALDASGMQSAGFQILEVKLVLACGSYLLFAEGMEMESMVVCSYNRGRNSLLTTHTSNHDCSLSEVDMIARVQGMGCRGCSCMFTGRRVPYRGGSATGQDCRRLLEAQGGKVAVVSNRAEGARFSC